MILPDSKETRPARALVVDDDPATARLLEFQLTRGGYRVAVSHQGLVALNFVEAFDPDVVLLDLDLPDVPGSEVLSRLRLAEGNSRRRVIVVLSATLQPWLGVSLGEADAVESKPIGPSTLLRRLSELHVPPQVSVTMGADVHAIAF